MSLVDAQAAIKAGTLTSLELVDAALSNIEQSAHLKTFVRIDADGARGAAKASDTNSARGCTGGQLAGIPLAHKDVFDRVGHVTRCGSSIPSVPATRTATSVERLDRAGAIDLGALNMSEFAQNPTGHNRNFGTCCNPWHLDYAAGGSSSGAAAAVAARQVFGALGSDTGGSIRIPAAFCGVTGLKPTWGRVSRNGAMPLVPSHDCVGPIARSARDCARLLGIIAGPDPLDASTVETAVPNYEAGLDVDLAGVRFGIMGDTLFTEVDGDVADAVGTAQTVLESLGLIPIQVSAPILEEAEAYGTVVSMAETASTHFSGARGMPSAYSDHVLGRLYPGFAIPAAAYLTSFAARGRILRTFAHQVFGAAEVIVMPTVPIRVPLLAACNLDMDQEEPLAVYRKIARHTRPFNYLGLPALSIPCGRDRNGLPVGLQIVGRPFAEGLLLAIADQFQAITDWHTLSHGKVTSHWNGGAETAFAPYLRR